jgi:hypothetical protein
MNRRKWLGAAISAITICSAMGFAAPTVRAQDITQADKDKAIALLEKSKAEVLDAVKGLSGAQWNFKAAPEKWSIAECMEHIAAAEDFIRDLDKNNVMKAPAAPGRDTAAIDAGILEHVPDRTNKAQAPEPIKPTNRYGSPEGSVKHFVESRAITEDFVKNTPDLRGHAVDGPMGPNAPKIDGYEWILLIGAHSERHTKQILEVKADPNYPKK